MNTARPNRGPTNPRHRQRTEVLRPGRRSERTRPSRRPLNLQQPPQAEYGRQPRRFITQAQQNLVDQQRQNEELRIRQMQQQQQNEYLQAQQLQYQQAQQLQHQQMQNQQAQYQQILNEQFVNEQVQQQRFLIQQHQNQRYQDQDIQNCLLQQDQIAAFEATEVTVGTVSRAEEWASMPRVCEGAEGRIYDTAAYQASELGEPGPSMVEGENGEAEEEEIVWRIPTAGALGRSQSAPIPEIPKMC